MKLGILAHKGTESKYKKAFEACESLGIEYEMIKLTGANWLKDVQESNANGFLTWPPKYDEMYSLYMERVYLMQYNLGKLLYPNYEELLPYENKRMKFQWLAVNDLPHLPAFITSHRDEAIDYINSAEFPVIFKSKIGSGSQAVKIIRRKKKDLKLSIMFLILKGQC